jgi:hypothetical protein
LASQDIGEPVIPLLAVCEARPILAEFPATVDFFQNGRYHPNSINRLFSRKPYHSVMDDTAIRQAAAQMITLHGSEAELTAARQADAMLNRGSISGFHRWTRITTAINDLERNLKFLRYGPAAEMSV